MVERYFLRPRVIIGVGATVFIVLVAFFLPTRENPVAKSKLQVFNRSESTKKYVISETKKLSEKPTKKYVISETKKLPAKPASNAKPIRQLPERCSAFDKTTSKVMNTTRKGCSIPIFKSTDQRDYYSRNSSCPKCTSALFKDYYRTHKAFIADGYWDVLYSGNRIKDATFRPPFCSFTRRDLDPDFARKCFSRKRIRKIVALGDSNGKYTFVGLKAILASLGIKRCEMVRSEKKLGQFMDMKYYLPPGTNLSTYYARIVRHACSSCYGGQYRCFYADKDTSGKSQNTSIILEYLPLSLIIDNALRIVNPMPGFKPADCTQEFLFRDYLSRSGQPDVVIISAPFTHEVRESVARHGKAGLQGAIRKLMTIVEKSVQKSAQVYWVPAQYVFGGNLLPGVARCNDDLYEVLKGEAGAVGSRTHGTFDLLAMSCPLVDLSISFDATHMRPKWYEVVGKHLLELICN